jgi:uncharacterized protein YdaU (DUF1376 family)
LDAILDSAGADMHYFKRNIGEYHKKAGKLNMLQHGAYTLLMDACYDREKFPTLDEAIDWCWASSSDEIAAVEFVLRKFFTLIDGVYVQNRISEEIEQYHDKALINKEIALNREQAKRDRKARTVHESITTEHEAAPKQETITIKQETINNLKELVPQQAATQKKRATRLPDDWKPDREYWDAAALINKSITQEWFVSTAHKFKDYWIAKSGKDATKTDWLATWRNWVRRDIENAGSKNGQYKTAAEKEAERNAYTFDLERARNF